MIRFSDELWARLGAAVPHGEDLTARQAVPDVTDRLFAAIDAEGVRHLLVHLGAQDAGLEDRGSKGLVVTTQELVIHGREVDRYIDLSCQDPAGHEAFDLIGADIGHALQQAVLEPSRCVSLVVAKWRRFWAEPRRQLLSREEQIGLFAELWFLATWLIPAAGPAAAARWRGPFKAAQDFQWPGIGVEVKATMSSRGRVHRIHGLEQLLPPENGYVMLFSLRLREEPGATNSLPEIVARCETLLAGDADARSTLDAALAEARYSPMHEEEYRHMRFRILDEALYRVEDDFPRLTAGRFGGAVPGGVEYVEYDINLAQCEHLVLARQPGTKELSHLA